MQTRAVNQQSVPGLVATLGPISASDIVYALVAEQRGRNEIELPKELLQDVESEPGSYQRGPAINVRQNLGGSQVCRNRRLDKSRNVHVSSKGPSRL